jgi:AspT/YidE/YbjL antiporter-like protein
VDYVEGLFKSAPEAAVFISIAIGYLIGRIKIGFFQLGSVAGTLLAAVFVGQITVAVSPQVKALCFGLFIFSVGYESGPQFFASLNAASVRQILLCVVVCVTGLLGTFAAAKIFDLDVGTAAGVLAGACTESASIGTAGEAIGRLGLDAAERTRLENNIAVGYAMTYLFGTLGVILFVRSLAPRILGINLRQSAKEYDAAHGHEPEAEDSAVEYFPIAVRAFKVAPEGHADGATVSAVCDELGPRVAIGRIFRAGLEVPVGLDVPLRAGDVVGVSGKRGLLAKGGEVIGTEIGDQRVLADATHVADVVVTNKKIAGKTLFHLATSPPRETRSRASASTCRRSHARAARFPARGT